MYFEDMPEEVQQGLIDEAKRAEARLPDYIYPMAAKLFDGEPVTILGPQFSFFGETSGRWNWLRCERANGERFDTLACCLIVDGERLMPKGPPRRPRNFIAERMAAMVAAAGGIGDRL